jgi:hypothetical protein
MAAAAESVWTNLQKARKMLQRADAELLELAAATKYLHEPHAASRCEEHVARRYTNWLVNGRQVAVSVNAAGRAAGNPAEFASWWHALAANPIHGFFRDQRNQALKRVEDVIVSNVIAVDAARRMAYWAFPEGPHAGDPLVPRCQQYTDWLYYELWCPAAELLYPWTLRERESEPVTVLQLR